MGAEVQADPGLKAHPVSSFDTEKDWQCFQLEPLLFLQLAHTPTPRDARVPARFGVLRPHRAQRFGRYGHSSEALLRVHRGQDQAAGAKGGAIM